MGNRLENCTRSYFCDLAGIYMSGGVGDEAIEYEIRGPCCIDSGMDLLLLSSFPI